MKNAIIGLGTIGKVHSKVVRELFGDFYAVCDIDDKKFTDYPHSRHYIDYKEMLDDISPNIVHICTPHYLHAEMIIECLKRDINVLCEKPMCINHEEIAQILQAEKASKAKLGICMQNRYNAANVFIKDHLADKEILAGSGNVVWHRDSEYYSSGEWRGKWDTEGGGVLINQALHTLDILQWIMGMPESVSAVISNLTLKEQIEVEDTAFALFSGNDSNFSFFATNGSAKDFKVELMFRTKDEHIYVINDLVLINNELVKFEQNTAVYGKLCYGSGHKRLISDFYDCIKNDRSFEINGEEAAKVVKLILGIYESKGEKTII